MAIRKTKTEVKTTKAAPKTTVKLNAAKTAFEEYKKKMEATKAMPTMETKTASPLSSPYGMSFMPPQAPLMGVPQYHHFSSPSPSGMSPKGSLFESLGNMMRLGVDVMNAGLTGGLQMMEGFSRHEAGGCHPHQDSCCCDPCHPTYHGHSDCCCRSSCCCDSCNCCCTPSVHNCC